MPAGLPSAAERGWGFAELYPLGLLALGVAVLVAVVALSQQRDRAFSAAVVYLLMGAALAIGLDGLGVALLDPFEDTEVIEHAAEFGVIIALFSAGIRLDRRLELRSWSSTVRLIGIVMPLTIAGVAAFAGLVMGLSLGAALVLGAVLAPTDPVLARDLQVGPPGEEAEEPEAQFALTSEAGLNDGLAFPFVFLGLFVADPESGWFASWLLGDVLYAVAVGLALGALGGRLLGWLTARLREREWLLAEYDGWLAIAAVLGIYGLTEAAGAYGFLAAFAGGLAFRRRERTHEYHRPIHEGAETAEKLSELAVVLLLGSTVTLAGLTEPGLEGWALVAVLLLAIRPLATLIGFAGSRLPVRERAFLGWFGIRGIGSLFYVAVAIGSGVFTAAEASELYWTVILCAGVSIIAHGVTATPVVRRLERA